MTTMKTKNKNPNFDKKKIFLVEDHPVYRQGLAHYINRESDLTVCGEAVNADQALDAIGKTKPDLVLVDLSLKESNGLDLIKSIKSQYRDVSCLVLSMHDEGLYGERVLLAGARGYVMKEEEPENIVKAIRRILSGKIYLSESMTEKMLEKKAEGQPEGVSAVSTLSDRELEVFRLIGEGQATAKIAKNLHLSVKTVETYRANIKIKLKLPDNMQLIRHAVEWVENEKKS